MGVKGCLVLFNSTQCRSGCSSVDEAPRGDTPAGSASGLLLMRAVRMITRESAVVMCWCLWIAEDNCMRY